MRPKKAPDTPYAMPRYGTYENVKLSYVDVYPTWFEVRAEYVNPLRTDGKEGEDTIKLRFSMPVDNKIFRTMFRSVPRNKRVEPNEGQDFGFWKLTGAAVGSDKDGTRVLSKVCIERES